MFSFTITRNFTQSKNKVREPEENLAKELNQLDRFYKAAVARRDNPNNVRSEVALYDHTSGFEELRIDDHVFKIQALILEQHSEVELLRKLESIFAVDDCNDAIDSLHDLNEREKIMLEEIATDGKTSAHKHEEAVKFFTKLIDGVKIQAEIDQLEGDGSDR